MAQKPALGLTHGGGAALCPTIQSWGKPEHLAFLGHVSGGVDNSWCSQSLPSPRSRGLQQTLPLFCTPPHPKVLPSTSTVGLCTAGLQDSNPLPGHCSLSSPSHMAFGKVISLKS